MVSNVKGRLEGRVAIVTGASRGIGRATALAFGREGVKVVVNYRQHKANAEEVVDEIKELGGSALAYQADVGDRDAVEGMVEEAVVKFGGVDILVNNAGVAMGGGPLLEFKEEEFDPMWSVNVKGILHCTRAVVPHMMERRYGKVVNIASVAGLGTALLPGNMLYASTKAAVIILTKRLALELGQYGINVNAIAPGLIRTCHCFAEAPTNRESVYSTSRRRACSVESVSRRTSPMSPSSSPPRNPASSRDR